MYTFLDFEELLTMPPMATVGDYGALYLTGVGRDIRMGGAGATFPSWRI